MKRLVLIVLVIAVNSCQNDSCLESLKKVDINLNIRSKEEFENGEMLKAIKTNDEAIRLNPSNYIAISNRGVFRYNLHKEKGRLGKYSKSKIISDLTRSVELCPEYRISLRNLIRIAYNLKEFEVIVNYSEEYNIRLEKSSELLSRLGDAYWEMGDYEKGIKVIDEAVQIEPTFDYAYIIRGKCYYKLGKYDQAIRDFSEALERNNTFSLAYHEGGVCYLKKKEL